MLGCWGRDFARDASCGASDALSIWKFCLVDAADNKADLSLDGKCEARRESGKAQKTMQSRGSRFGRSYGSRRATVLHHVLTSRPGLNSGLEGRGRTFRAGWHGHGESCHGLVWNQAGDVGSERGVLKSRCVGLRPFQQQPSPTTRGKSSGARHCRMLRSTLA